MIALLGAVLDSGAWGPLVGWVEVRVRSASSQRGGHGQYEACMALPSPALPCICLSPFLTLTLQHTGPWRWLCGRGSVRSSVYCEC